jgi:tetratricopeptide (TPR) repeat protein
METTLVHSLTQKREHDRQVYQQLIENNTGLLAIDPFLPFPRSNLAVALDNLGRRDEAIREVQQALEYEPNYVRGYMQLAGWYAEMGKEAEANRYRATAVEIVNRYREYQPTDPYIGLLLARPQESWRPPAPH